MTMTPKEKEEKQQELRNKRNEAENNFYEYKDVLKKKQGLEDEDEKLLFRANNFYDELEDDICADMSDIHYDATFFDARDDISSMKADIYDDTKNATQFLTQSIKDFQQEMDDIDHQIRYIN